MNFVINNPKFQTNNLDFCSLNKQGILMNGLVKAGKANNKLSAIATIGKLPPNLQASADSFLMPLASKSSAQYLRGENMIKSFAQEVEGLPPSAEEKIFNQLMVRNIYQTNSVTYFLNKKRLAEDLVRVADFKALINAPASDQAQSVLVQAFPRVRLRNNVFIGLANVPVWASVAIWFIKHPPLIEMILMQTSALVLATFFLSFAKDIKRLPWDMLLVAASAAVIAVDAISHYHLLG